MGNQFSTVYFCAHCEDEVVGLPYGIRTVSERPLCLRCTKIGVDEGWATTHQDLRKQEPYETHPKPGIIIFLIFLVSVALAAWVISFLVEGGSE